MTFQAEDPDAATHVKLLEGGGADDPDVVQVFPIDYERLVKRLKSAKWYALATGFMLLLLALYLRDDNRSHSSSAYCFESLSFATAALFVAVFLGMYATERKHEQQIRGMHVALTHKGIRHDTVDEKTGVPTTTTYPLAQIRRVERGSGGMVRIKLWGRMTKPVEMEGLYDAYDFIELVHKRKKEAHHQQEVGLGCRRQSR